VLSPQPHRAEVEGIVGRSYLSAFRVVMAIGALLALASAVCAFVLVEGKVKPPGGVTQSAR